jgi:hypothetical protein
MEGKNPWHPLYRRLGGLQSRSERGGEEKNPQPLPGLEPSITQPVAQRYINELYLLLTMDQNDSRLNSSKRFWCRTKILNRI